MFFQISSRATMFFSLVSFFITTMAIFNYTSLDNLIIAHLILSFSMVITLIGGLDDAA